MRRQAYVLSAVLIVLLVTTIAACGGASNAGQIIFGTTVDTSAMKVANPITTVKTGTPLGWVAYFTDAANSTSLTLTVASVGQGSAETNLGSFPVSVSNPSFNEFAHQPDTSLSSQSPGTYTLRYIRPSDNKVLASGTIQITQ